MPIACTQAQVKCTNTEGPFWFWEEQGNFHELWAWRSVDTNSWNPQESSEESIDVLGNKLMLCMEEQQPINLIKQRCVGSPSWPNQCSPHFCFLLKQKQGLWKSQSKPISLPECNWLPQFNSTQRAFIEDLLAFVLGIHSLEPMWRDSFLHGFILSQLLCS